MQSDQIPHLHLAPLNTTQLQRTEEGGSTSTPMARIADVDPKAPRGHRRLCGTPTDDSLEPIVRGAVAQSRLSNKSAQRPDFPIARNWNRRTVPPAIELGPSAP